MSANDILEKMLGYSKEEILLTNFVPYVEPKDIERTFYHFEKVKQGIPQNYDITVVHRNGHHLEMKITNIPIKVDNQIVGVYGIAYDITEQKRYIETIEQLSYQNSLILNSVAEGIYGLDLNQKIIFCNSAAADMLGYSIEELEKNTPQESFWRFRSKQGITYSKSEVKDTIYWGEEFYRKDGSSFPVELTRTPIYDKGKIIGYVVNFSDISERQQMEHIKEEQKQLEMELLLAASVQQSLLTNVDSLKLQSPIEVGVISVPARTLNGDFYNFDNSEQEFLFAIADIPGKGVGR